MKYALITLALLVLVAAHLKSAPNSACAGPPISELENGLKRLSEFVASNYKKTGNAELASDFEKSQTAWKAYQEAQHKFLTRLNSEMASSNYYMATHERLNYLTQIAVEQEVIEKARKAKSK